MVDPHWAELFEAAEGARQRAYAPYSRFRVGAAVRGEDGRVFVGCNVENASFGLTVCAERNAVAALVAGGASKAVAVAIVVDSDRPTPPCGMCRQVLSELGDAGLEIASRTLRGEEARWSMEALLPFQFGRGFLG